MGFEVQRKYPFDVFVSVIESSICPLVFPDRITTVLWTFAKQLQESEALQVARVRQCVLITYRGRSVKWDLSGGYVVR